MPARQSQNNDLPNKPLPEKKAIKGLPRNADISRTSSGNIAVSYRYRSKSDLALSGGKSMRHLGMVVNMEFVPSRDYLLHPELFPVPEKQMRGRRVEMMKKQPAAPEEEVTAACDASVDADAAKPHPLKDATKSVSYSAGASLAVIRAGKSAGVLDALYTALAKVFGPQGLNVDTLYRQIVTCAMHTAVTGSADRHLESFCENYATPCRMTSQSASDLYEFLGTHINALRQAFFEETVKLIPEDDQLTTDGTYYNCEGRKISYAQIGVGKDGTYKRQISQLIVYSTKTGLPILYMTNPGNMHDSQTLKGLRELCDHFNLANMNTMMTFDRGFLDTLEMIRYHKEGIHYLLCVRMNYGAVERVKQKHKQRLRSFATYLTGEDMHAVCEQVEIRSGNDTAKPFLHLFYSPRWAASEAKDLMTKVEAFKHAWDNGRADKLKSSIQAVKDFFKPLVEGSPAEPDYEKLDRYIEETFGYFALMSSNINDSRTAAKLYGLRNSSEICFKTEKTLGRRTARSHNEATFSGKDFCMFVATMFASNILHRLSSWKNDEYSDETTQPLNRNHDYMELMKIFSGIRIQRAPTNTAPWFVNAGGKAVALLKVLNLDTDWKDSLSFMNVLTLPPKRAKDAALKAGWIH